MFTKGVDAISYTWVKSAFKTEQHECQIVSRFPYKGLIEDCAAPAGNP